MDLDLNSHTPGPWHIGVGGQDSGRRGLTKDLTVYEVRTNHPEGPWACIWAIRETDARLIAAAPELLEALEAYFDPTRGDAWTMGKAAIAKATSSPDPASLPVTEKG